MATSSSAPTRQLRLAWALSLTGLLLELVTVAGFAVMSLVQEASGGADQARAGLGVALFYVTIAIALGAISHGVFRRRRWAAAPGVTIQLFGFFALGWPLLTAGYPVGYLIAGLTVVVAAALIAQVRSLPKPRRFQT